MLADYEESLAGDEQEGRHSPSNASLGDLSDGVATVPMEIHNCDVAEEDQAERDARRAAYLALPPYRDHTAPSTKDTLRAITATARAAGASVKLADVPKIPFAALEVPASHPPPMVGRGRGTRTFTERFPDMVDQVSAGWEGPPSAFTHLGRHSLLWCSALRLWSSEVLITDTMMDLCSPADPLYSSP